MDNPTTTQYAGLMHNFILKARSTVREIDPQNDLTFLRIRSKKNEIMVAPENRGDGPSSLSALGRLEKAALPSTGRCRSHLAEAPTGDVQVYLLFAQRLEVA
ncbi:dynein light chain roadblock-type 1 isoform X2 [Rhinolophus ferrumequinum]|nr:dynein light chain roadblock-type 1 isoform X2 [Rhinolophus ferrumequinum]